MLKPISTVEEYMAIFKFMFVLYKLKVISMQECQEIVGILKTKTPAGVRTMATLQAIRNTT